MNQHRLLSLMGNYFQCRILCTFTEDLGADSLDLYQIILGVEDAFDIEIPQEEAEKIVTVADAIDLIQRVVE